MSVPTAETSTDEITVSFAEVVQELAADPVGSVQVERARLAVLTRKQAERIQVLTEQLASTRRGPVTE